MNAPNPSADKLFSVSRQELSRWTSNFGVAVLAAIVIGVLALFALAWFLLPVGYTNYEYYRTPSPDGSYVCIVGFREYGFNKAEEAIWIAPNESSDSATWHLIEDWGRWVFEGSNWSSSRKLDVEADPMRDSSRGVVGRIERWRDVEITVHVER